MFKHAARHLERSHLFKSFKDLLTYGHLPYCYAVTGVSLKLDEKLGKMTLNEWVTKGLLCVTADKADHGKFFVEMPFMMLYHIYHSKEGIRHPILRLIKTPTLQLSSEDAEHLDLNTVLSRLYAASVVGKKEVSLKWLIPVAGVADISLSIPASEVAALELKEIDNGGKKVTGENIASVIEELESKSPQQVYAFVNGPKASSCDWFIVFKDVCYPDGKMRDYPTRQRQKRNSSGELVMEQPRESRYFVLAGQSKRYIVTKLQAEVFWAEYQKALSIARNFGPFVLVVITDSPEVEEVPEALSSFVFCIAGEGFTSFQGPAMSQRRQHALQNMLK